MYYRHRFPVPNRSPAATSRPIRPIFLLPTARSLNWILFPPQPPTMIMKNPIIRLRQQNKWLKMKSCNFKCLHRLPKSIRASTVITKFTMFHPKPSWSSFSATACRLRWTPRRIVEWKIRCLWKRKSWTLSIFNTWCFKRDINFFTVY